MTKAKCGTLSLLTPDEQVTVLKQILKRHPEFCVEAEALATNLLDDISVEATSEEVSFRISRIGIEELDARSGRQLYGGYVEPTEAAWELLEEAIADIREEMGRRVRAVMEAVAVKICQGIVVGLYDVRTTGSDDALGWAPDFPQGAATSTVSMLVKLFPADERRAAGRRIIAGIERKVDDWVEMLEWVVDQTVAKSSVKSGVRKRR